MEYKVVHTTYFINRTKLERDLESKQEKAKENFHYPANLTTASHKNIRNNSRCKIPFVNKKFLC